MQNTPNKNNYVRNIYKTIVVADIVYLNVSNRCACSKCSQGRRHGVCDD